MRSKLIAEPWDCGPGGYQVGELSAGLGGVERHVPRHGPRFLEVAGVPPSAHRAAALRIRRHCSITTVAETLVLR